MQLGWIPKSFKNIEVISPKVNFKFFSFSKVNEIFETSVMNLILFFKGFKILFDIIGLFGE